MAAIKTCAIVLRHVNYRDSDRMLTLFSPELGRIEAKARGCLKQKSPLIAASELFAVGEYLLYQKSGRHTVTGFALEESYYPLRADYDRLRYGAYLLSLVEAVVMPEQPNEPLFVLLRSALAHLAYGEEAEPEAVAACFLMLFTQALGYQPMLYGCVHCGLTESARWCWDSLAGGLVCRNCQSAGEILPPETLSFVRGIQLLGWEALETRPEPVAVCQALRLLRRFVESRTEKRIISAKLL